MIWTYASMYVGKEETELWYCDFCRRNKFDPFWNEIVVAGFRDGKP